LSPGLKRDYRFDMPEEVGLAVDAARAREAMLIQRFRLSAGADRSMIPAVSRAAARVLAGRERLDLIAAEIDNAVANQDALALNTPAGARNFSGFLLAKTQDIKQVIADALADCSSNAALLRSLRPFYATAPSPDEIPVPRGPITWCIQPGGTSGKWRCSVLDPDLGVSDYWSFTDESGGSSP
jgi:hypothetical protein